MAEGKLVTDTEVDEPDVTGEDSREVCLRDGLPPLPANGDSYEDRLKLAKVRACMNLLLQARILLGNMIEKGEASMDEKMKEREQRLAEEKRLRGNLTVQEIQAVLQRSAPGEDEEDLVKLIQELKAKLVVELRKNHALDRKLAKLDKRIALLIKNRGNLQMIMSNMKKKDDEKTHKRREARTINLNSKAVENYQDLFYLLQTEPRYLARVVYQVSADQMESFLETTILTLYGDAFSPREEFLVLRLFQLAMQHEISVIQQVSDFLQAETVVPKMIVTYNRRKQGLDYIQRVLGPVMNTVLETDRNMELNPLTIYIKMINEAEIRTGEKTKLERQVKPEEALDHPEVKRIVDSRLEELTDICKMFVEAILRSVNELPYGLRWICKQLADISKENLPDATELDIQRLIGYFVYYRFLNLAIVAPDSKGAQLVKKELTPLARKSCVVISKVLQNLFNLRVFVEDNKPDTISMMRLNPFLEEFKPKVAAYFDSLIKVDDPEDHLQVNKYMELTQKTKPMIQISLHEIFQTHAMVHKHLQGVAPEENDPLRKVMVDLGDPPEHLDLTEEEDRDIQLTLTNRFKVDVEEESDADRLYAETKELLIPILRVVPVKTSIQRLNLMDVLEHGIKFARETQDQELNTQIDTILKNLGTLESDGMLSKADNYEGFIRDVALEVINRNAIRDQQKKEVVRLQTTLKNLQFHQTYLEDQIKEYNSYLEDVLQSFYQQPTSKKKKGKSGESKIGPFKFAYNDLVKRGVLLDSEVPVVSRKKTVFYISSDEPGVFDIAAKIGGVNVHKMQLRFDDLLERHYNNISTLQLEQVTLSITLLIHLLNQLFMKGAKK
eukprot:CAMPEP_0119131044 /NCGR_PEP_ID=MMETSP1310-20130426/9300_1 /TAXON_ID=464262 /ORGANISM="Genus nov. species nov., Strain RCC2339" /LENGTH=838 /DNA_ID=CAMNT_0007121595 /DNA_START=153 /DNA_END=2669 /DNA_ORIENTATION=+